jgi:hypothetical protein
MTEVGTYILRQKEQTIFCKTNNPNLPKRKYLFGGFICQQVVGIPMSTNRAPLLDNLFLYSFGAYFL